uniref:Nuclear protein MDM1 n=1 Tax=Saccoglossus kowalevskii TaxID=10224 RepID=A0ABM0M8N2_SACKO|nr:PREDICTED: nuclear protein MDM1-like isoform X6 [Saccoglossus kowalevskii]
MIYNSNAIQTYMPKNVPSKSEYDAQFQAWNESRPSQVEMLKEHAKRDAELEVKQKKKSSKGKRRKSGSKKEVVTPDQMPAAGVPTFHLPEQLKNAQNPQKPFFPHAAIKKWKSEYRSNYHDPRVFSYMDGVWRGADPPHIEPRDESSKQEKIGVAPDWFGEVVELRKKAQEYQKRARGTHFSREHLAQLLAQQVKMWEMESVSSTSTLTPSERTVSTARPAAGKTYTKEVAAQQQAKLAREEERRKLTPSPSPSPHDSERTPQPASVKRKLAWPVDEKPRQEEVSSIGTIPTPESLQSSSRDTLTPNDDDEEGRIPTPRLTKKPDASKQRHHLARTTPAVGGALLSSPNIKRSSGVKKQSPSSKESGAKLQPASENGYRSDDEDSVPQLSRKMVQKSSPKHSRYQADKVPCSCGADVKSHTKLIKSPSAGVHTRDPDPIEENYPTSPFQRHSQNRFETGPVRLPEESSPPRPVDSRPLKTWAGHPVDQPRPKVTPKKDSRESDQPPSYLRKPAEAWSVPLEPSTRAAQYSRPDSGFITPPPRPEARLDLQDDEDRWSVKSTGTVSSSCSLASEVLERARRRRDEFWGKQPSVQTK